MRELTQKEYAWVVRLEKLLDKMPLGICILVNQDQIIVTRPSEVQRYFDEHSHTDSPEELYEIITCGDIRPNGESI